MNTKETIKALKSSQLFRELSDEALASVAEKAKFRQFFPEEVIVWQGNPSDSLYLIINGIVAVKKVTGPNDKLTLAYLMSGNSFGEVGLLENRPRSANVESVSDVDLLVLRRDDFMKILYKYPESAVALAKMLGQYLVESNRRSSRKGSNAKLILIFDTFEGGGATGLGLMLSMMLYKKTETRTVYTEYPATQDMVLDLGLDRKTGTHRHAGGFDILTTSQNFGSGRLETSLAIDQLMTTYENIVVTLKVDLSQNIDEQTVMMLDYANQIIILVPPSDEIWGAVQETKKHLKKHINQETGIITVVSRSIPQYRDTKMNEMADFDIPFLEDYPSVKELKEAEPKIPASLLETADSITDRLDRTNQISVFIPTTVDVDVTLDTSVYVQKTLDFLAERFGGATSKEAQGVWNSKDSGLVGEKVFIVNTFVSRTAMNMYLDEVVEFIKGIKVDLRQEAMALEVNQKLTLI